jgi:hypothetical protein
MELADGNQRGAATKASPQISRFQRTRWREAGLPFESAADRTAVAALVRRGRPLERVALVLFVRGYTIQEQGLRKAYRWCFAEIDKLINEAAGDETDPWRRAEAVAIHLKQTQAKSALLKAMTRALQGSDESPGSILTSALTHFFAPFLGGTQGTPEGARELAAAMGVARLPDQPNKTLLIEPDHAEWLSVELMAMLANFRLAELKRIADTAPHSDLERARDELAAVIDVLANAQLSIPLSKTDTSDPIAQAVVVLALVIFRQLLGDASYATIFALGQALAPRQHNPNWGGLRRRGPIGQPGGGITSKSP